MLTNHTAGQHVEDLNPTTAPRQPFRRSARALTMQTVLTRPPIEGSAMPTVDDSASAGCRSEVRWDADQALTELYTAHWQALVRLSYLLVRDQSLAEEVVQDAFVAVHGRWHRLKDPDRALAYLRVTVVNGSRSTLRRHGVRRRWLEAGGPTPLEPAPRGTAVAPSAEETVLHRQERAAVNTVLAALPTRQREVLVLRYHAGLSEAEIAEALDISRGAVKSHAHRGLAAIRRNLSTSLGES